MAGKTEIVQKDQILILFLLGVLLLVIALPAGDPAAKNGRTADGQNMWTEDAKNGQDVRVETQCQESERSKRRELEEQLEQLLCGVSGIGRADVMIAFKSDGKRIVEKDIEQKEEKEERDQEGAGTVSSQSGSSESTVYSRDEQGNELPYVTQELEPEIAGVLVSAQGAGNPEIVREITEAVMALFGVEAHKIKVMKME